MYSHFRIPHCWRLVAVLLLIVSLSWVALPARSQDAPRTIESDDARVARTGSWSNQAAAGASGGSYLYSSGAVLTLEFSGPSIEVIYVAGPGLGTLAIEIDDTVLRTVITTSDQTAYQQSAKINYLTDETHILKVYAQAGGVIGVDAFLISPSLVSESGPAGEVAFLDEGGIQSSSCAPTNSIHRVSYTSAGLEALDDSVDPSISGDGRYVAFESYASLVPGDGDIEQDIYVVDRLTCAVELISVSSSGTKANDTSSTPSISGDGRYVAFYSYATNLVVGDLNAFQDVFVRDRQLGTTIRVSVSTAAVEGNDDSYEPAISADGRFVAFESDATNLIANDTNALRDVFVHNLTTSNTFRLSIATGGAQATGGSSYAPAISSTGRYVVYESSATNLVAGDTNSEYDIFVRDRQLNTTIRVSVATGGTQTIGGSSYDPTISADGRYVAFESFATNLVAADTNGDTDVFLHDTTTTTTTRASIITGGGQSTGGSSSDATISADGRYIAFESSATNLVTGDTNSETDVFRYDRTALTTIRISVDASGIEGNNDSSDAAISGDGRFVAMEVEATNFISGDTNEEDDVYVAPITQPTDDTLALFNPTFNQVNLLDTLADSPPYTAYTSFSAYAQISGGQWVMGDWDGDGQKTPGIYNNGPFYYTNVAGESLVSEWRSLWIGIAGAPVAGKFDDALPHDCIGAVQSASFPPFGTAFVLYYTCDLSGNTAPTISNQWLSVVLPDSGGFTGTHQFAAGDFDDDGDDSIAVRRGTTIAFGNVAPVDGSAAFDLAQYIGAPGVGSEGIFVAGDWDANGIDSFGLYYQNGEFYYRNDLLFNSGTYVNQTVGTPMGTTGIQATSWR